jgi:hypothetical protein
MRLPTGQFFGTTDRQLEVEGLRFSATDYEPLQEKPWHTHEHPAFFATLTRGRPSEAYRLRQSSPSDERKRAKALLWA